MGFQVRGSWLRGLIDTGLKEVIKVSSFLSMPTRLFLVWGIFISHFALSPLRIMGMFLHRREKEISLSHTATGLNRRAASLAAAAASSALTGCGFRPRGGSLFRLRPLCLPVSDRSTLKWELRRRIMRNQCPCRGSTADMLER